MVYGSFAQEPVQEAVDKNKVSDYFQNEQYSEAIQYLKNKESTAANSISFLNSLGYAYYMNDEKEKAEPYYQQTLKQDSLNFSANRYMALIQIEYKNYNEALFYYNRLLQAQPRNAMLHKLKGDIYVTKNNRDSALINYAAGYAIQPQNVKIVYSYADGLLDKELYPKADSVVKAFLTTDSLSFLIIKLAIRSAYEQKKYDWAASFTNRWMQSDLMDIATTKQLALANYNIKRYKDCFAVCDTILKQGIEIETLYYYAAKAQYKMGQYKRSNDLLQRCLDMALSKTAETYYAGRADNFESLHQFKSAIAAYDSAYYLFKNPLCLYNIGRIYEKNLNNKTLAQQYYRKYIHVAKPKGDERGAYDYVKQYLALAKQ